MAEPKKGLYIEYMPLSELKRWPRNPKDHDIGELHVSIDRFGFVTPFVIDEATKTLAEGHGRLDTLEQKKNLGSEPPKNVTPKDGDWLVPVVRGNSFADENELSAFIIAANQLTIRGWWDEGALALVLKDLQETDERLLQGTGFDTEQLNNLLSKLNPLPMDDIAHSTLQNVPGDLGFDVIATVPTTDDRDTVVEWLNARGYPNEVRIARHAPKVATNGL